MPYHRDDLDDRDDPQPEDIEDLDRDEDEDEGEQCPACGASLYAGAPRCPRCGEWLPEDTPAERRSRGWMWPVMVGLLIAIILVIWQGL